MHYNAAAHAKIAATLASQFVGTAKANPATQTSAQRAAKSKP
jgi:hypothetical protein